MRKTKTRVAIATIGLLIGVPAALGADSTAPCDLFTPEEIATYLGEPVDAGADSGMGCQWLALDDDGDAMIIAVPSDYAERPTLAPGFKEAATIAPDAFVVPEMGGWAAGATTGDSFVKVSVTGAAAGEDSALAFLADTIRRRGD